jgi:hypothetical protein
LFKQLDEPEKKKILYFSHVWHPGHNPLFADLRTLSPAEVRLLSVAILPNLAQAQEK